MTNQPSNVYDVRIISAEMKTATAEMKTATTIRIKESSLQIDVRHNLIKNEIFLKEEPRREVCKEENSHDQ